MLRAWLGYQQLLEAEMAQSGFAKRDFPDGRVLHLVSRSTEVTISQIGRELGVTRQAASKLVGVLKVRGFVTLRPSPTDGREKLVIPTAQATRYLEAQRHAARSIERRVRAELGEEASDALASLLQALGGTDTPRLHEYLRTKASGHLVEWDT